MEKAKRQKPKYNMLQTSGFMVKLAFKTKEKKVVFLGTALALLTVAIQVTNLYITPVILNAVEEHSPFEQVLATILLFVAASVVLYTVKTYIDENILFGRISVRTSIINKLAEKRGTTSYCNLTDQNYTMLANKAAEATNGNTQATEAVWTTLTTLFANVLGFAIYAALLGSLQVLLLAAILTTALCGYAVNYKLSEFAYKHREEYSAQSNIMRYINDQAQSTKAAKDIRIFGLRPWLTEIATKAELAYASLQKREESRLFWARTADFVLAFLRNGIAYAYLIYLAANGQISVAQFVLYFSAVEGFSEWVTGILGNISELHRQSLELSTVMECLGYPEPFRFENGKPLAAENIPYELKLENVGYRYAGADNFALQNINLTLHAGEKLAVVGLNGAGKTTLIKLMCGFYDPTEGQITLNGVDIREYNRRDYYKMFSAVFQKYCLLAGTVAANVAQSETEIDMDRVRDCVEKAGLTTKITSLEHGFNTKLQRKVYEDAAMLSGGEEQRLMLARALYKDAPFVMLDEPTAALDPLAEADLYRKYGEMTKGKSSVYISHRLASTRFCDRIVLIADGKIAEEGTHESLMSKGGKYAELFEVQSKYYKDGNDTNKNFRRKRYE